VKMWQKLIRSLDRHRISLQSRASKRHSKLGKKVILKMKLHLSLLLLKIKMAMKKKSLFQKMMVFDKLL